MASLSFCDFSDSSEGTIPPPSTVPASSQPAQSTFRSPLQGPNAPRLDVDWSDSPPLSLSLRFSGIFSDADLEGDVSRRTHQSRSVSLDMSYDVQTFPNLKDILPDFTNDSDISEVVLMTPKLPATLSTIPEAVEPSPVLTYTTSLSDFDIVHIGGTSESGTSVMLCKRRRTGTMYKIRCRHDHVPWAEQDILEMLRDLGAPFLPHLRSSFREEGRVHLVLDHFPSGSLGELVQRTGSLTTQRVVFYASEIIVGISNLHSIGIMHRNVNPDDIMIDPSGHVVIGNFEFADFVASSGMSPSTLSPGGFLHFPRAQTYQAPEVLLGWAHDSVVDCWGFGMVLYFMFFGKHPFKNGIGPETSEDLQARVIEGTLSPDSLRLIHPQTRDLILKCIERNPRVRLTLDEIKRHNFFANVSWSKVADRQIEVPPLPGTFENNGRYNSGGPPSSMISTLGAQRPAVEVRPLRIEKKNSRSPLVSSSARNLVALEYPSDTGSGHPGVHTPQIKTYPPLRPAETWRSAKAKDEDKERVGSGAAIWDILDQEELEEQLQQGRQEHQGGGSHRHGTEFGRNLMSFFKSRKVRSPPAQHQPHQERTTTTGSIYGPKHLFMNLSTASFSRSKKASSPALASASLKPGTPGIFQHRNVSSTTTGTIESPDAVVLPTGLEHIGNGIGFSYPHTPAIRRSSRVSIASATTRGCHNLFGSSGARLLSSSSSSSKHAANKVLGLLPLAMDGVMPDGAYIFDGEPPVVPRSSPAAVSGDGAKSAAATPWMPAFVPTMQPPYHVVEDNVHPASSASSSESDDGPFTPTALEGEEGSRGCSKGFEVAEGTLEGKMEPDLTLRLVTPSYT